MTSRERIREQTIQAFSGLFEEKPEALREELARLDEANRIVDSLLDARHAAGLSQRELAAAAGLSASKICRMESGCDADLNFGDVQAYLKGLGTTLRVSFRPPRRRPRRPRPTPALA